MGMISPKCFFLRGYWGAGWGILVFLVLTHIEECGATDAPPQTVGVGVVPEYIRFRSRSMWEGIQTISGFPSKLPPELSLLR